MRWFKRREPPEPEAAFLDLLAEHGLAAYERQAAFEQRVGDLDWQLDQDRGAVMLGDDLVLPAQLLGSEALNARTWLWAWANESIDAELAIKSSEARSIGEARGLTWMTEPQIDTQRTGDGYLLALATSGLLEADAYYPCPYPGGVAYALVDLPQDLRFPPSPATAERVVHVITNALQDGPRLVSRASIERYLTTIGAEAESSGDLILIGENATFRFDELGRLTGIEATLEAEPTS